MTLTQFLVRSGRYVGNKITKQYVDEFHFTEEVRAQRLPRQKKLPCGGLERFFAVRRCVAVDFKADLGLERFGAEKLPAAVVAPSFWSSTLLLVER